MIQSELARTFRAGQLPTKDYISRLEDSFSAREASVRAFVPEKDRFERLFKEAELLQTRYPKPEDRPPLFGMTVGVKDIFHVDGFATQAGCRLPAEVLNGGQALSVTAIQEAGGLIMGKTVTTEFAYFSPGPTRNPHNLDHTPGGSSSGSAAAVGAGLCVLALGTQTIGSIIRPAAFCGVVGVKPTAGRTSREGVIPLSKSLDHVGYFSPDVSTGKMIAKVLIRDWGSEVNNRKPILGIPEGPYLASASDFALRFFQDICRSLEEAGYELRRVPVLEEFQEIRSRHEIILAKDAASVHHKWFQEFGHLYSEKLSELIRRGQSITNDQYQSAMAARDEFRDEMARSMLEHKIDLWICPPTIGPAPKGLESTGDPVMNLPWTQIGYPAISLPAGKDPTNLPMGLQVVGRWGSDESLLTWALDLEKVLG